MGEAEKEMTNEEINTAVAELVTKIAKRGEDGRLCWNDDTPEARRHVWPPSYATDPAADYEVLKHVREKWDYKQKSAFIYALMALMRIRDTQYSTVGCAMLVFMGNDADAKGVQVGDYSRAALAALAALPKPLSKGERNPKVEE